MTCLLGIGTIFPALTPISLSVKAHLYIEVIIVSLLVQYFQAVIIVESLK